MKLFKKYIILLLCLLISAVCFNLFQYPNQIVTGGIGGISIIVNKYINIKPSTIVLIISIIILLISLIILGPLKTSASFISTISYPILIKLTSNINTYLNLKITNYLILSIIIGILSGITNGIVYKIGFNNGGLSSLSEIIHKYTKIPLYMVVFIINILIIIIGGLTIGYNMLFYSTLILLINSIIIKKILKNKGKILI